MIRSFGTLLATLIFSMGISTGSAKVAISAETTVTSKTKPSLMLSIQPYEDHLLSGEPFVVKVSIKNQGNNELKLPGLLDDPGADYLTFKIRDDKGQIIGYTPQSIPDVMYPPDYQGITLKTSEKYTVWLDLTRQGDGDLVFDKPGTYSIRAFYHWGRDFPSLTKTEATSRPVSISIQNPQGNNNSAYKLFISPPKIAINSTGSILESVKHFQRLINIYPTSVYAKYSQVRLAGYRDLIASITRDPNDYQQSIKEWNKVITAYKLFGYSVYAKEKIAYDLIDSGNKAEAKSYLTNLISDSSVPDSRKRLFRALIRDIDQGR